MRLKMLLTILFTVLIYSDNSTNYDNAGTEVYKLLYMNDYGALIKEKTFWNAVEDGYDSAFHKSNMIHSDELKEYLYTLHHDSPYEGFQYSFAFVFNRKDTIYASYDLKKWILKEDGQELFFSGPAENSMESSKKYYKNLFIDPFFEPCW